MTVHDLKITNGRLVLPDRVEEGDILIDGGLIKAIMKPGVAVTQKAAAEINAKKFLVLPGLVDVHVHFREPGYTEKEDFATGSLAAAAGGVTTIADMPNTQPPTNTPTHLLEKRRLAEKKCIVDFAFHGGPFLPDKFEPPEAIRRERQEVVMIDIAKQMMDAGIVSFKIYMPHQEGFCLPFFGALGHIITIHAEEPSKLSEPKDGSSFAFLASRPPEAEVLAIERLLKDPPKCSFHICHISTAAGFRYILAAQHRGVAVTTEVTPHHLLLTVKDLAQIGPIAKCFPPLRSSTDTQALRNACFSNQIKIIASDHAPHTSAEKTGPNADFKTAPGGINGVETTLPLLYTKLVHNAEMKLPQLIQMMGYNPALRFGIRNKNLREKGQIMIGADADLVLFDPKAAYTIRGDRLHSKSSVSPYEGWKVRGKVRQTLLRGKTIFCSDEE